MHRNDLDEIYATYSVEVYRFLLYLCKDEQLAEDILQDTFLKAIENIEHFDARCKLSSWLCQIAKNLYFDYLRKTRNKTFVELEEGDALDPRSSQLDSIIRKETSAEIMEIVHQLQEPYKEIFLLRVYGDMAFKEIATLFGKNDTWARVMYMRARKMVYQCYEEKVR